jgi:hypothetical protein
MTDSANSHLEERRKFLSEAFHSLHQPLTGLHCGLELALHKQRSEQEYRQRISEALQHAGEVLKLNKALRELVDAADPGERFGTVALAPLLAQLAGELALVADPAGVKIEVEADSALQLRADPMKLLRSLGNVGSRLISSGVGKAILGIVVTLEQNDVLISLTMTPARASEANGHQGDKATQIRLDAAQAYLWTIEGDLEWQQNGATIRLPRAAAR